MNNISFILVLLALFSVAYSYTVTFGIKNEWPTQMILNQVTLKSGVWLKKPPTTITGSSSVYVADEWEVSGDSIEGSAFYVSGNQYGHAIFNFQVNSAGSNFTANVGPSPYIGGVGDITGTTDIVVDYWVHQMCTATVLSLIHI
eukprot:TRINITY_DN3575_c0_g1_i5.p1 TRINITY_DN3575_c0_g1~~TRINITY_DN3575_c0_g1_i5.p1  ORF type:complete len:144 (-),score=19.36 TRINITY_DN3575_c0_g1_i5:16-447(-)